jgi:hypothetical protein
LAPVVVALLVANMAVNRSAISVTMLAIFLAWLGWLYVVERSHRGLR